MLLTVMATFLPPAVVIPVHGIIQLGSNGGRAVLMRQHIRWPVWVLFAAGAAIGTIVAARVLLFLPLQVLLGVLGLFVLYSVWAPQWRSATIPTVVYAIVGAVTGFVTMFVGATGPLVASFLSPEKLGRQGLVGTLAACMVWQHSVKGLVFGMVGFAFAPWLPLMAAMIISGFIGTLLGRRLLQILSERDFAVLFRLVMTLLAARVLYRAIVGA